MRQTITSAIAAIWRRLKASPHWNAYHLAEHGSGIPIKIGDRYTHLDWTSYSVLMRIAKGVGEEEILKELKIGHAAYNQILKGLYNQIGTTDTLGIRRVAVENGLIAE
jgi:hypothetical protein